MACGDRPSASSAKGASLLGCAICLALLAGCSRGVKVRAEWLSPAAVPVRAFPEIWVAGGYLDEEERVLARLAESLASGGKHRVRRVDLDALEGMRLRGQIPSSAAVLLVEVRLREELRASWETAPVQVCGPYGCQTQYQQMRTNVPWLRASALLRVYEGPTARLLQRHVVRVDGQGSDPATLRLRVADQLAERVAQAVQANARQEQIVLLEVDSVEVEQALQSIEAGDWAGGRKRMEAAIRSPAVRRLPPDEQARVFYDLGLARRFAPEGGYSPEAFAAADQAFERAIQLDPQPRYEHARAALRIHRGAHQQLVAQRDAARHNFALRGRSADHTAEPHPAQGAPPASGIPPAPGGSPSTSVPSTAPDEEAFEPRSPHREK